MMLGYNRKVVFFISYHDSLVVRTEKIGNESPIFLSEKWIHLGVED